MKKTYFGFCLALSLLCQTAFGHDPVTLKVYSSRNEHLVKPLFEAYEKATSNHVKIEYRTDKPGPLLQRLQAEKGQPKADIFLTVDAGNLWKAGDWGLLDPIDSKTLEQNIPKHLKDPNNQWFGLSVRARTIAYNKNKVNPKELSTYQDLASAQWKDRLVLRTSKKVYNQSLVAMLIKHEGTEEASNIVQGWVGNLAVPPFSNDTKTLQAIAAGVGDVGIVNSYYYGRLIKKDPNFPVALYWPNQNSTGVHVNISGAGIVKGSTNKQEAIRFIEWLSKETAQRILADENMEYPANPQIAPNAIVSSWGTFQADTTNISSAGQLQKQAIILMDQQGYR
jgi:iron(III) transport system substrate-binding protein